MTWKIIHRYRDSIVYKNKKTEEYNNCVFGAFVLFPYKYEEKFKEHSFYKSIEEVNIRGIPFLPSTTGLMEEFLDKLINESSYSTFERALDVLGREEYMKDEYFSDRSVLVGALRNKEQLQINLKNRFYHTKCSNVNLAEHNVRYIALAQSKTQFKDEAGIIYYGKVTDIKSVKRSDIKEILKASEEPYYIFKVEEWEQIERKIQVKGYQVQKVLYTTEFLLKNASIVTELCIKSKEEYRLWQELRRISCLTEAEAEKNINSSSGIKGFSVEGMKVFMQDNEINVVVNDNLYRFGKEEFNRKPREVMQRIFFSFNTSRDTDFSRNYRGCIK